MAANVSHGPKSPVQSQAAELAILETEARYEDATLGHPASVDSLRKIVAHLQNQARAQEKEKVESARKELVEIRRNRTTTESQILSAVSVVGIFVATLSVGLLSLARDTFSDRGSTPAHPTDHAVNAFWYLALLLSLLGGGFAGIGAASRNGVTRNPEKDELWEGATVLAIDCMLENTFAVLTSLISLAMMLLIIGLLVFVWAEQAKPVALVVSIAMGLFGAGGVIVLFYIQVGYNRIYDLAGMRYGPSTRPSDGQR
ncbi:hypothetical protein BOTBODRAFT_31951 [Botryobasidium botryosum FD-172 SS1]|uniref:DUF6535 domain-containing protein n=1 Tax=Botryobasidium botryosum (strain FD-172 SS1) TaxID=930990 RepID=A0A067MUQ8_BOTB1|nr:hypothetical protein BOTBODRAFT_31951 [Botryobasidium botryosum FD-172 SS1]